ncbi:MAG: peroxiredoxin, peroxiredoxin Q/BCP [Armatimonadetes bacterium CSP1-3]|nr:MAG: peroxiredoxin, peroxiredoxin Q/BCP [Armatimonadetes bacterium CSP1-3]
MVEEGRPAPDFALQDAPGRTVRLRDFRGKRIVLYFYPKDDTPGCTTEACGFRDDYAAYAERDAVIIGVSPDGPAAHAKFAQKYDLPFILLADPDHAVAEAYGVWKEKQQFGRTYWGIERTTFVIDPRGRIDRIFRRVRPDGHSREVLEALAALAAS